MTENESLMKILGIIDPFLYNKKHKVMIMDANWKNQPPCVVEDISDDERSKRMESHLKNNPTPSPIEWNVDLDKIAERLMAKNQSIYGGLDDGLSFSRSDTSTVDELL